MKMTMTEVDFSSLKIDKENDIVSELLQFNYDTIKNIPKKKKINDILEKCKLFFGLPIFAIN